MLEKGDKVPLSISLKNAEGEKVCLKESLGKYVVIYFYPKDDTPGCTKEACSIRDLRGEIKKLGAEVIGVSKDSPTSHKKFINKYKLNFTLWSDENLELMKVFGVWQKKKFMGREYMGTVRATFVIDKKGKIIKVWEKVTPDKHGEEIVEFLKSLK